jgi:hypothetical protein
MTMKAPRKVPDGRYAAVVGVIAFVLVVAAFVYLVTTKRLSEAEHLRQQVAVSQILPAPRPEGDKPLLVYLSAFATRSPAHWAGARWRLSGANCHRSCQRRPYISSRPTRCESDMRLLQRQLRTQKPNQALAQNLKYRSDQPVRAHFLRTYRCAGLYGHGICVRPGARFILHAYASISNSAT